MVEWRTIILAVVIFLLAGGIVLASTIGKQAYQRYNVPNKPSDELIIMDAKDGTICYAFRGALDCEMFNPLAEE